MFSLKNKTALITGCSGGIGQGIALGLAEAGADIAAVDIASLKETKEKVEALGRSCICYNIDLSDTKALKQLFTKILQDLKAIDILVNNAGMQYRKTAFEYPEDVFDKVITVNLKAGYVLSQLSARHFCERADRTSVVSKRGSIGKIINMASLFSRFGGIEVSGYTCSKHGVLGMTRALSNEFAPYGINVNAIAPGYIQTDLTKAIWSDKERRKPMDARIPAGRWGIADDFKGAAVFLASEASDYITGIVLPVDGGYSNR